MRRIRVPRRSLHVQLTLLYAVPFLVSGVLLLAIPLLGSMQAVPAGPGEVLDDGAVPQRQLTTSAWAMVGLVVVSLVLGWSVARRFLRPLRTITATAREISASDLHRRLGRTGLQDEFTDLAETLDDLFGRLHASFGSQQQFIANVAHELRTPLAAQRAVLQVALAAPDATCETLRSACHEVLALGDQQERLVEALLTLAHGEQELQLHTPFDVSDTAAEVVAARQQDARQRDVRLHAALDRAPVVGDPDLVERLVANLVDNAVRHNAPGGWVKISTATSATGSTVRVANSGPPVPPGEVDALFEPFRRAGNQRTGHPDGHGLGLAVVRAIADAHGATLDPRARVTGGLDIEIRFPRRADPDVVG